MKRCIFRASGCSLSSFNKRFIFKFGGKMDMFTPCNKIEYYDIKFDTWTEVNYNQPSLDQMNFSFNAGSL